MLWENQSSVNNIKMKRKKIYSRQKNMVRVCGFSLWSEACRQNAATHLNKNV